MGATTILSAVGRYRLSVPESPEHWELYHRIRRDVLLEAQKYAIELTEELAPGHHPRLLWLDEHPIGSIRVDVVAPDRAALRLVAIHPEWQRKGHGAALLRLAEHLARELGCREAVVYATPEAAGFYSKASYAEDDWDDSYVGGIVQMAKKLI
jgi:GNAT superfamily N-acetyltransferase